MKILRILLIGTAVVAVLVIGLALLALTPSVQTWAARRALAQQPDLRGEVGRVAVGLNRVEVSALRLVRSGMILTVPAATIDLPVAKAAGKQIEIHRLVAKGWTVDLTAPVELPAKIAQVQGDGPRAVPLAAIGLAQVVNATVATPSTAPVPFDGIFKLLNLPVDLQVDDADLEGDVIFLTKPGEPPGRVHVTMTGGQLGAGRTGEFKIVSDARLSGANAPVNDLKATTTVQAKMTTPREFEWLTGVSDVTATGPKFPHGANLRLDLKAQRASKAEDYLLGIRSGENGGGKQLVDVRVSYPIDSRRLSGTWKVDAADGDLAPFALGLVLPTFVAAGEGRFETDNMFREVKASGRFESTLDKLETVSAPLATVGRIKVKTDFDVVQRESSLRVDRFSADAEGSRPIVAISALQMIELNPTTGELKVPDPAKDLFRVKLEGVPLAWVQAFVPNFSIGGDDVRGEFVARAHDSGVTVRSVSPLTILGFTVSQAGQALIQAVDIVATLTGDYSPRGWQADVTELALRSSGRPWATFLLKAGQTAGKDQPIKATGQYQIDLPSALRQPIAASYGELTKGRASGDFSGVITPALQQVAAKLDLRDLASPATTQPIPSISLNVRADLHPDGLIKIQAPLVVQQGDRKSDLETTAEIRPSGARQMIDAQVTSELLYVQDLQILAAPLQGAKSADPKPGKPTPKPPAPEKTPSTPGSSPSPDTAPFWAAVGGEFRLALKKVIYSPDVQAANVSGTVKITPETLSLENLHAVMGEGSSAKVAGGLTFDGKSKTPYALTGDVNVANLNPGPILALFSPSHKPTAEGSFDMVGKFNGEAPSPEALAATTSAEIKLTSRGGKFNGFAASALAVDASKLQKATSTAATLLGLASGLIGENKVATYAEKARAVSDIFKRFVEIPFDQLNLELSHRPGQATQIKDFSLISPDLRFAGTGGLESIPGKKLVDQPLHIDLFMAVRGDQEKDMRLLGALKDEKDSLGYSPLLEKIPIEGTLSNLTTDALTKFLGRYFPKP